MKLLFSPNQYRRIFEVLSRKEKNIFLALGLISIISLIVLGTSLYFRTTHVEPATGGTLIEGVIGQPRFINPVLASANDVDRDLSELTFAGLMKYADTGEIIPELASGYEIKDNGKTWEVTLKENLVFQDGSPLTVEDVIFTVKTIQDPEYKSPLRPNWLGVETEMISDSIIRFKLKNSYPPFIENLTLKIIPKNIWKEISPENFTLAIFNLKPIGSGPYKVAKVLQEKDKTGRIKSIELEINPKYAGGALPKIKKITFVFFDNEENLIKAAKKQKIETLVLPSPKQKDLLTQKHFLVNKFNLPRYFAVFLNPGNQLLKEKGVRQALNYAVNKREIIERALDNNGSPVDSPILPLLFGLNEPETTLKFSFKKANELLDKAGFKINPETNVREKTVERKLTFEFKSKLVKGSQGAEVKELQKCLAKDETIYPEGEVSGIFGDKTKAAVIRFQEKYRQEILVPAGLSEGNGETGILTRSKLNEFCFGPKTQTLPLKFSLVTVDDPLLIETAEILKAQWAVIGIDVEIQSVSFGQLNSDFLKTRSYDALLFGEVLGQTLDPFPFWHSSQKKDPGLNLAVYENKEADKLLEEARQSFDDEIKQQKLEKFQEIIIADAPAVFLYQPDFIYLAPQKLKGINSGFISDPSKRFAGIENWYLETKRVFK
ncbi:MAG: ABC transporter substrate-binding protein [bacterium]|nr:ABC transporter substrate-binding protein [bacterium]